MCLPDHVVPVKQWLLCQLVVNEWTCDIDNNQHYTYKGPSEPPFHPVRCPKRCDYMVLTYTSILNGVNIYIYIKWC